MMPPLLAEWVQKAEDDFEAAQVLSRRRKRPLRDAACFHCQQCVEKYLKAYLVKHGVAPPRIHNLVQLLHLCTLHDPKLSGHLSLTRGLNSYSVDLRYPGIFATADEAKDATLLL